MPVTERRFAGFPSAFIYARPNDTRQTNRIDQVLWGDYVGLTDRARNGWVPVQVRNQKTGWMQLGDLQEKRLLEIVFVDIGQGDGCLVVTPDDKFMVIDAGQGDNMARFLRWRFRSSKPIEFEYAILSHSDLDHYGGFARLFETQNFTFKTVCTNGLMERAGGGKDDLLGHRVPRGGEEYIEDLVTSLAELKTFVADSARVGTKKYPRMLKSALTIGKFQDFRMLSVEDRHLPGYEKGKMVEIQVLGPVVERNMAGKAGLRWFKDPGKTKNGHSIVLRLVYGGVSVLLGGDLNIPSERLLLEHHTGKSMPPASQADREALIESARRTFAVDFAKACHHGSADFTNEFLAALNPLATIISSGDDEPHAHPRADTLGALGRHSRGARPLIFSTELARSAPERSKAPQLLREELDALVRAVAEARTAAQKAALKKQQAKLSEKLTRSVAVYGAINLRTDGKRAVVGQRLERAGSFGKCWDLYALEPDANGVLHYRSQHEA